MVSKKGLMKLAEKFIMKLHSNSLSEIFDIKVNVIIIYPPSQLLALKGLKASNNKTFLFSNRYPLSKLKNIMVFLYIDQRFPSIFVNFSWNGNSQFGKNIFFFSIVDCTSFNRWILILKYGVQYDIIAILCVSILSNKDDRFSKGFFSCLISCHLSHYWTIHYQI
jgi:hypothetical protein